MLEDFNTSYHNDFTVEYNGFFVSLSLWAATQGCHNAFYHSIYLLSCTNYTSVPQDPKEMVQILLYCCLQRDYRE